MAELKAFKEKVSQLRTTMQNFKSHHKATDIVVSNFIGELPFPFRTFAKIIWTGLESEQDGSDKMLTILERIADTTNEEFDRLNVKLDELIKKEAASDAEIIQVGKEILDQNKKILDLVVMKLDNLSKVEWFLDNHSRDIAKIINENWTKESGLFASCIYENGALYIKD